MASEGVAADERSRDLVIQPWVDSVGVHNNSARHRPRWHGCGHLPAISQQSWPSPCGVQCAVRGLLLRLWWSGRVRVRVRVRPSAPPLVEWACEFARACARVRPSPLAGPSSLWYPRPRCLLLLERQRLGTWPSSGLRTQLRHAADGGVSMLLDSTALLSRRHVDMAARDGSLPTLPLGRSLMQTPSCCMPMVQARPMLSPSQWMLQHQHQHHHQPASPWQRTAMCPCAHVPMCPCVHDERWPIASRVFPCLPLPLAQSALTSYRRLTGVPPARQSDMSGRLTLVAGRRRPRSACSTPARRRRATGGLEAPQRVPDLLLL